MASHVRPWTVKWIHQAIRMFELISVKQPVWLLCCSLTKREAVYIPLRETVDIFGAKGEANTDFITCNNLVAVYIIRMMGCISSCILKRITIVDNHRKDAIHVLQNPERFVLQEILDCFETILAYECKISAALIVIKMARQICYLSELGPFNSDSSAWYRKPLLFAVDLHVGLHNSVLVESKEKWNFGSVVFKRCSVYQFSNNFVVRGNNNAVEIILRNLASL
jgi:hypothetical protein